jgi:hypothetical protein
LTIELVIVHCPLAIEMPSLLDLLLVAFLTVVLPLVDTVFFWPATRRRTRADPSGAKKRLWLSAIVQPWAAVAIVAALWAANGRSWWDFGFPVPQGWRLWVAIVLCLLVAAYYAVAVIAVRRSSEMMANLRQQAEPIADLMPHTRSEMYWFGGVSLTAGFCEEFQYRGYFVWTLSAWLGWWGAAALSVLLFAGGHAYQGWNGVIRTGILGAGYTLTVAALDSLWPAIVLHALWDLGAGLLAWLALREPITN